MSESIATVRIRSTIKTLLKRHGSSYRELALALDLSESSIKQLMTKGNFTTDRLEKIAEYFGLYMSEFFEMAFQEDQTSYMLTSKQEEMLAANPTAMHVLFLLSGFPAQEAKKRADIDEKSWKKALFALAKENFIELGEGDTVRLKIRGPYMWNLGGILANAVVPDYLNFLKENLMLPSLLPGALQSTFELYMTEELFEQFKADLRKLVYRYFHLARLDVAAKSPRRIKPYNAIFSLRQLDAWGPVLKRRAKK